MHSFVGLDSWSLKLAHIFNLKEHVGARERPTRTTKMSWWWGSSPSTTMARIKGKQFLYIFSLAFWDLFQIWEFWLDFDMIWFGKCWLWLIPLLGWLSCGQMVVGMGNGVTKEYEEEWALWLLLIFFFFGLRWKRVKSVFANCVGFIWVFFIAMDSKTRLVFLFIYIYIYILIITARLGFVNFSGIFWTFLGF